MAGKIKIELTEPQLRAIIEMANDMSAMVGGSDTDKEWNHNIKLIDRMLKKNGYERQYQ